MFRFIIEYSSLRDFYKAPTRVNRFSFMEGVLKNDILACVET